MSAGGGLRLALGAAALAAGLAGAHVMLVDPPLTTDPAHVEALYRRVLGEELPRPTGSEADRQAVARIAAELAALGYTPEIQAGFACAPNGMCAFTENVLARHAGTGTGAVVLAAHHDTVPASPGGYDDGAGVIAQLEIARQLRSLPPTRRSIVLLFTDAEELALNGARAFVDAHPWAAEVEAMIALEAMGGPTTTFRGARRLALHRWAAAQGLPSPRFTSALEYLDPAPGFDSAVFEAWGIPSLVFTGEGHGPRYHTPLDRGDAVDLRAVAARADWGLRYARALAEALPERDATVAASVVVPGAGTLAWPEAALRGAGPLVWVVVVALAIADRRRARGAATSLLGEVVWALVLAGAATAALLALLLALRRVEALVGMWIAWPSALGAGLVGLATAAMVLARAAVDRWAALIALALVGAALSWLAPAGAHLLLIPALVGAAAGVVPVARRVLAPTAALLALGLVIGQVEALSWLVNMGAVYVFLAGAAAVEALLLVALLDDDEDARPRLGARAPRAALLGALGLAGVIASMVGARVGTGPDGEALGGALERVSVRLHQDLDHHRQRWIVADVLPEGLAAAAPFAREAAPFGWWPQAPAFVASATVAPASTDPGPELIEAPRPAPTAPGPEAGAVSGADAGAMPGAPEVPAPAGPRVFRGHLRSPSGAWSLSLALPPDAPVRAVRIHGEAVTLAPATIARARGHQVYGIYGARTASVAIEIELGTSAPVEVELIEHHLGLPPHARGLGHRRRPNQVPAHAGDGVLRTRRLGL